MSSTERGEIVRPGKRVTFDVGEDGGDFGDPHHVGEKFVDTVYFNEIGQLEFVHIQKSVPVWQNIRPSRLSASRA